MMYWCKPYLISIDNQIKNQIYVFAEKNVCKIPHLKGGGGQDQVGDFQHFQKIHPWKHA